MQKCYLFYILGVLLLTLPVGLFFRKQFKVATLPELFDRPLLRFGWMHPLNVLDLVRAYAGMTFLIAAFADISPAAPGMLISRVVLAIAALVGLVMQHVFNSNKDSEIPTPIAYVIGLTFALLPLNVALLALPLGIASAIAMQNLAFGLVLTAAATALIGKLLGQSLPVIGTVSLLLFLPVMISLLFHRQLGLSVRRLPVVYASPLR